MKLSQIKAAKAAIESGSRVPSSLFTGVWYRVRGISCADARKLRDQLIAAIPREERLNGIKPEAATKIDIRVIAEVLWIGVEGLTDDGGAEIVLTREKALELLSDPEFDLLLADVRSAAAAVGERELADAEHDAKN